MSGINSGILRNAYPLSAAQIKEVEKDVILNNKCIAYLNENNEICFAEPFDPVAVKNFAWNHVHQIFEQDGSFIKKVYKKTGLDTFDRTATLIKGSLNASWESSHCVWHGQVELKNNMLEYDDGSTSPTTQWYCDGLVAPPYVPTDVTYKVLWNNETYICNKPIVFSLNSNNSNFPPRSYILIGNPAHMQLDLSGYGFKHNNEPFCIAIAGYGMSVYTDTQSLPLDYKFSEFFEFSLEYEIPVNYDGGPVQCDLLAPTNLAYFDSSLGGFVIHGINIDTNRDYVVTWNGTKFNCTAIDAVFNMNGQMIPCSVVGDATVLSTGVPSGAYPFVLGYSNLVGATLVIPLDGSASPELGITCLKKSL